MQSSPREEHALLRVTRGMIRIHEITRGGVGRSARGRDLTLDILESRAAVGVEDLRIVAASVVVGVLDLESRRY